MTVTFWRPWSKLFFFFFCYSLMWRRIGKRTVLCGHSASVLHDLAWMWTTPLQVPIETRGGCVLLSWSYRHWWDAWYRFWGPNPGLKVRSALSTAERSLKHLQWLFNSRPRAAFRRSDITLSARMFRSFLGFFLDSVFFWKLYFYRNNPNI